MRDWSKSIHHILMGLICLCCMNCGKRIDQVSETRDAEMIGAFWSRLQPLNQHVMKHEGWLTLTLRDNQFWARIKVFSKKTKVSHFQFLHVYGECPTMQDDLNHDGFLDFQEAYRKIGDILIPFDSNLNSQLKGMNEFPRMGFHNYYYYTESSNFERMISDLRGDDFDSYDLMTKLKTNEKFNLSERVVMIYGIEDEIQLPTTVSGFLGYPISWTLPIACGKIQPGASDIFMSYDEKKTGEGFASFISN
jgi:hypothetical protein